MPPDIALDGRAASPSKGGIGAFIRRHPVSAFFIMAFVGTWSLFVPILLSPRGLGVIDLPDAVGFGFFLLSTYCGPFLAAWVITRLTEGPEGVRGWFKRMLQWRTGALWYLLVLVGYPLIFAVPSLVEGGSQTVAAAAANWRSFIPAYLTAIPVGFLLPTLGEEAGWRGFALTRLQRSRSPLQATLVVASLHALWHLPAYFVKGAIVDSGFDMNIFIANSVAIIGLSVVWTWLFNHADQSIFFATFVHADQQCHVQQSANCPAHHRAGLVARSCDRRCTCSARRPAHARPPRIQRKARPMMRMRAILRPMIVIVPLVLSSVACGLGSALPSIPGLPPKPSMSDQPTGSSPMSGDWHADTDFGRFSFSVDPEGTQVITAVIQMSGFGCGGTLLSTETQVLNSWPIEGTDFQGDVTLDSDNFLYMDFDATYDPESRTFSGTWVEDAHGTECSGDFKTAPHQ